MLVSKITKAKKKIEKVAVPEAAVVPVSASERKSISNVLELAKFEFGKINATPIAIKAKKQEIETLEGMIREFMGPFLLIGYDLHNDAVEMISANTTAEYDSLLERLRRVYAKINQNLIATNGTDPYGVNST